ncbi:MAG TPA: hypothetical protein VJT84_06075, partial [Gaiellaceae bacterium]|nr:hypothetical protein [Gaiellaceae bacterium]
AVRAVSDTPDHPLGPLGAAVSPTGRPRPAQALAALLRQPAATTRALANIRAALRALRSASPGGGRA